MIHHQDKDTPNPYPITNITPGCVVFDTQLGVDYSSTVH